jgi:hypothetical protein
MREEEIEESNQQLIIDFDFPSTFFTAGEISSVETD